MSLDVICDHNGILINGKPFVPEIPGNALLIGLDASLRSDLKWDGARELAKGANGRYLLWEFDWGSDEFSLYDPVVFQAFGQAIDHFVKTLWEEFKEETLGVVLYRGTIDFADRFIWPLEHLEECGQSSVSYATVFAAYLHRLLSFFPDVVQPFCLFDTSGCGSRSRLAQLLSKERFEHIHLSLSATQTSELAICLPHDDYLTDEQLDRLDQVMAELQSQGAAYRIISESRLAQEWDGIEKLLILPEAVSPMGRRLLQGFEAAGGEILSVGEK